MAAITQSAIADGLRAIGVRPGGVLMVHTRMSALGWVVGGSEAVVRALLDALGPEGTLVVYASWAEHVYHEDDWPPEHRAAYAADPPVWDPGTGAVDPDYGRIPERVRTWPGALRSDHPEASVAAVGPHAAALVRDHPREDGYGPDGPLARLCGLGGQVLLLGAPLETLTILHHAEAIAPVEPKRRVTFVVRERDGDRTYTDIDTSLGAFPYEDLGLAEDAFEVIGRDALAAGHGRRGTIGAATCHLLDADELTRFGVAWLAQRFGAP